MRGDVESLLASKQLTIALAAQINQPIKAVTLRVASTLLEHVFLSNYLELIRLKFKIFVMNFSDNVLT